MPKYNVQLTRLAVVWQKVEVEAENDDDARACAMEQVEGDESGWELNGIFDDGTPVSKLEVTEVEEL